MNVTNIGDDVIPKPGEGKDRLDLIFARQFELLHKYHPIEKANGLSQTDDVPVSLHDRFGQARLKDFAWRVTEELAEALEAFEHNNYVHFIEELADGYHFLTELSILTGLTADAISPSRTIDKLDDVFVLSPDFINPQKGAWAVTQSLGLAMNCLKCKPWKQTHLLTDVSKFKGLIVDAHINYAGLCRVAGMTPGDLFAIYFKKSEVNNWRMRTGY